LKKKQKLVTVHVTTTPAPGEPSIVPVEGDPLEVLLADWRVLQIQPLGQGADESTYVALLLLEEAKEEPSLGRLGFGRE
jgi:hypothetical protein